VNLQALQLPLSLVPAQSLVVPLHFHVANNVQVLEEFILKTTVEPHSKLTLEIHLPTGNAEV
jgi:LEA14-like dessication related protein